MKEKKDDKKGFKAFTVKEVINNIRNKDKKVEPKDKKNKGIGGR